MPCPKYGASRLQIWSEPTPNMERADRVGVLNGIMDALIQTAEKTTICRRRTLLQNMECPDVLACRQAGIELSRTAKENRNYSGSTFQRLRLIVF